MGRVRLRLGMKADSEIERIIAERYGKKVSNKSRLSRKKVMDDSDEDGSDSDLDAGQRGKSKKRSGEKRHSDSEDEAEGRRKRRKRDESSDNESQCQRLRRKGTKEKRRRTHRHSDDSDSDASEDSGRRHERKSQRLVLSSNFDASGSDDLRVGKGIKRSKRKSQKRQHKVKE